MPQPFLDPVTADKVRVIKGEEARNEFEKIQKAAPGLMASGLLKVPCLNPHFLAGSASHDQPRRPRFNGPDCRFHLATRRSVQNSTSFLSGLLPEKKTSCCLAVETF